MPRNWDTQARDEHMNESNRTVNYMELLMISPEIIGDLVMGKYLGYNF